MDSDNSRRRGALRIRQTQGMAWTDPKSAQTYGRELLQGERVRLRPLHEDDLAELERWWNDPVETVLQSNKVLPRPDGWASGLIRAWSSNDKSSGGGFSIESLAEKRLVGHLSLSGADVTTRCADFAIIIGAEHQGRGFGSEAIRMALRYGFDEMGLHRIQLAVWAYNERAIGAYAKAGFREEGHRREVVFHDGMFHDEVLMAILEQEWRGYARPTAVVPRGEP